MTIVFGIALGTGWMTPYWAGLAVALISLPTAGQSLNKGLNRMMGTLLGCAAALVLLALFPQQRFAFMGVLSVYVAICTWMMTGKRFQYFWNVAGFVCLLICLVGPEGEALFNRTVNRTLATGTGILVYTLVSVFLWPRTSATSLTGTALKLLNTQAKLFTIYRNQAVGKDAGEFVELRIGEIQLLEQLESTLESAGSESYEVYEVAHLWRRLKRLSTELMEVMEMWREGFTEIREIDSGKVLPEMASVCSEIERRFQGIEQMFGGEPPGHAIREVSIRPAPAVMEQLSHFERAAIMATVTQLNRIERLTRSVFQCVEDLKGLKVDTRSVEAEAKRSEWLVPDLDRFQSVIMVLVSLWFIFFVWVYFNPPGHAALLQMVPTLAFAIAQGPQLRMQSLFLPFAIGIVMAGVIYILIMPQLQGFLQLGTMIFVVWFLIDYLFWKPSQGMLRLVLAVLFLVMVKIQNQQTYDFASFANMGAFIMLCLILLTVTSRIPMSRVPDQAMRRLLSRFSRSVAFLLSRMASTPPPATLRERFRVAFHRYELSTIPTRLWAWSRVLDCSVLGSTTPEQVRELLTNLHALSFRFRELLDARAEPQSERLKEELVKDFRSWRVAVQEYFHVLAENPMELPPTAELRERLDRRMSALEKRIEFTLNKPEPGELNQKEMTNFYRLLGGFRGFSEAALAVAGSSQRIDWERWEEARF